MKKYIQYVSFLNIILLIVFVTSCNDHPPKESLKTDTASVSLNVSKTIGGKSIKDAPVLILQCKYKSKNIFSESRGKYFGKDS